MTHFPITPGTSLRFDYTNAKDERSIRTVTVRELQFGHDPAGTYDSADFKFLAWDEDKQALRAFRLSRIDPTTVRRMWLPTELTPLTPQDQ